VEAQAHAKPEPSGLEPAGLQLVLSPRCVVGAATTVIAHTGRIRRDTGLVHATHESRRRGVVNDEQQPIADRQSHLGADEASTSPVEAA
jgi:hypothetical protein